MKHETFPLLITDLLSVPDDRTRWILIKKAMAASVGQASTRPIEFAYGSLDKITARLLAQKDEQSEFIMIEEGVEPHDPTDDDEDERPVWLKDFVAKRKRAAARRKVSTAENGSLDEEDVSEIDTDGGVDSQVEAKPQNDARASESASSGQDEVPETKEDSLPVPPAVAVLVGELQADVEPMTNDLPAESDRNKAMELEKTAGHDDAGRDVFTVSKAAIATVQDARARRILERKFLSAFVKRKYTRSLGSFIKSAGGWDQLLKNAPNEITVLHGEEPIDGTDSGNYPVLLEVFASQGEGALPKQPVKAVKENSAKKRQVPSQSTSPGVLAARRPLSNPGTVKPSVNDQGYEEALRQEISKAHMQTGGGEEQVEYLARWLELEAARLRLAIVRN